MLNDTIVNELTDVKACLDKKAKMLHARELDLKKIESNFCKQKAAAIKELDAAF